MAPQRESTKCPLACEYCRVKKAKCSGIFPCGNCTDHNEACVFPEKRKRTRKRKEREIEMEDRLARMEELLRASAAHNSVGESQPSCRINSPDLSQESWMRSTEQSAQNNCDGETSEQTPPQLTPSAQEASSATIVASPYPAMSLIFPDQIDYSQPLDQDTITIDPSCSQIPTIQTANTISATSNFRVPVSPPSTTAAEHTASIEAEDQDENQECASYLSICTFPAIKWVSSQAGMSDFLLSARRLSKTVMQGERLGQVTGSTRTLEPSYEVAMEWSKAYFDSCLDSIFGIIHRDDFEKRLQDHFQTNPNSCSDASWYALRNTIYASGCRVSLCADSGPEPFSRSRAQSWKYFENALSVHTELLYVSTDITSIQALILMAFHAEALGTPALEFMLVSSATRLAQAKGLHMRGSRSSKGDHMDTLSKQCLWWIIYAYEKHLAYRSGIPSAIDDDSMTCLVPTELRRGSGTTMEFVKQTIALARLSSSITKRLSAVKAMRDPPDVVLTIVHDLDHQLQMWREGLDPTFQKQPLFEPIVCLRVRR
uniref:Zn(2)-C6 fungal-type domain-containing protein n=1 Tax=Bionectria ochroleuca TaxID=29856 RepID=A0A8H7K6F2_BIOOC